MPTRFGRQPLRDVMHSQRWNVPLLAAEVGVTTGQLGSVCNGRTPPSPHLREALCHVLDRSLADLFTPEALSAEYGAKHVPLVYVRRQRVQS